MHSVLVIIVTYNAMPWAEKCLGSIKNSNYPADIFIVDNGSSDGTQEYIKNNYPGAIFTQNESNLGFGKANNLGLKYALDNGYEYVYLLNQDAWILPDTLDKLISTHERHPEYGILSPMQCQANMCRLDCKFAANVCFKVKDEMLLNDLYFNSLKEIYEVPVVMAAHWLLSKECLIKVGGFSPTFPHYGEDDNYCDRTRYYNFRIGIVPETLAVHNRESRVSTRANQLYMFYIDILRQSSSPMLEKKATSIFGGAIRLMIKHKTLNPIVSICKYVLKRKIIKKNRIISIRTKTAFLF